MTAAITLTSGGSRPRQNLGVARVKFWSIVVIAYHYIVLWGHWGRVARQ